MKKQQLIDTLTKQGQEIKSELTQLQESFNVKKDQLVRIEGALEALSILEDETPPVPPESKVPDHSEALAALAAAGM